MPAGVLINVAVKGIKQVGAQFQKLGSQIKGLGTPINNLSSKAKKLGEGISNLSSKAKLLGTGLSKVDKDARKASFGMAHMIARSITLVAVLGAVFKAVQLVTDGFKKAFDAVEKYAKQVAGITALTITFMKTKPGEGLADQYIRARDYARGLYTVIEDIAAQTLLTGQQAALMARTFLENGVAINYQNQEQVQGLKSIANALAIVTEGQAKERQIRSEINNLLKGQIRPTEALGTLLKNINPNIKEQLKIWKQQGTIIENVSTLLKGFNATTGDISLTWEAVSTTLSTTADRVLRGAFQPVYKDILDITLRLNKWLEKNKDLIQIEMLSAYKDIKVILGVVVDFVKVWIRLVRNNLDVIKETYFWIKEGLKGMAEWATQGIRGVTEWANKINILTKDGERVGLKEAWLEGAKALGITVEKADDLKKSLSEIFSLSKARDNRLTLQLTEEGLDYNTIQKNLKNIPETLKESLDAKEIKQLIEEGFTSGFLSASDAVEIMSKRIVTGKEKLMELSEVAKSAGVEFNNVQLTRILRDIPQLEKVSKDTFAKVARGIREISVAGKGKFVLLPDFAKLIIPEFKKIESETEKALEKLFARIRARMEKFALEAEGIGLRGDALEEFRITKKFDRMLLARKAFIDKEKAVLTEKNPELLKELETQLKKESDKIQTEREFQLNIYKEYTTKIRDLQRQSQVVDLATKNIKQQQELSKYYRNEAKFRKDAVVLVKLEQQARITSLDTAIEEIKKKRELKEIDKATGDAIIESLNTQKMLEDELYDIQLRRTELLGSAMGSLQVGIEDTLNSYRSYSEQMMELGKATAGGLQNAFRELFFDFMNGELKSAEEYWKAFATGIMGTLADNLSQLAVKFIALGVAKLFAKDTEDISQAAKIQAESVAVGQLTTAYIALGIAKKFAGVAGGAGGAAGGAVAGATTQHSGGLIMHDGGEVPSYMKFHSGGLNNDERIAILQTRERVLSRDQNKIFESMVSTLADLRDARGETGVSVVNVYDETVVGRYAATGRGRKVIKNVLRG